MLSGYVAFHRFKGCKYSPAIRAANAALQPHKRVESCWGEKAAAKFGESTPVERPMPQRHHQPTARRLPGTAAQQIRSVNIATVGNSSLHRAPFASG